MGLDGKVTIVTGGASNIGRAIAHEFGREKARVVILDIDAPQAEKTVQEIVDAGGSATSFVLDVTDVEKTKAVIAQVEQAVGPVATLVNNVGWNDDADFFLNFTPEHWEKQFRLNVFSTFNVTRAVLPFMVERREGSIILISSDCGFGAIPLASDYGAMKGGLFSFARVLAQEYGRYGIRVNTVAPGVVQADPDSIGAGSFHYEDFKPLAPDVVKRLENATPLKKLPEAEDVAATTVFMASDRARALSGQLVSVSGGYVMPR